MSAPIDQQPTIMHRVVQGGLLIAMPATLAVLGGPAAVWSNGGYIVRIILTANMIPTTICTVGAVESLARTVYIVSKDLIESGTFSALPQDEELGKEIHRLTGMTRAALFPISGAAVVFKLPVYDYYVYAIPAEALRKGADGTYEVAVRVNKVLNAIHFWDGVFHVCDWTVIPVCRGVGHVASAAFRLISWALG